jgi:hypothetical protein
MQKKKDLLRSRGRIILTLLFIAHVSAIAIPNILTVGIVLSKNMNIYCIPRSSYIYATDFICTSILCLVLAKGFYMKAKSMNWDMTNSMGYFVGFIYLILGTFSFLMMVFSPKMLRSPFRYVNVCAVDVIDYLIMDIKNPINFIFVFLGYVMLYKIKIWGVKQEFLNMLILILIYLSLKGLHHIFYPLCRFREELIENLFKIIFFNLNCSIFLWFFDDAQELFKSVKNNDLGYLVNWNDQFKKYFMKYLLYNNKLDELVFFVNDLEKNVNNFEEFYKHIGKIY